MDIQISFLYKKNNKALIAVSERLKKFAAKLNSNNKVLVDFVDDTTIMGLNKRFKGLDKPTNVLSFELNQSDPEDGTLTLGEIVISVDTAKKEAIYARISLNRRLLELFVHGYVHLLGYDHTLNKNEYIRMKKKENFFLRMIFSEKKKSTHK